MKYSINPFNKRMDEPDCEAALFQNEDEKLLKICFLETFSNIMFYI